MRNRTQCQPRNSRVDSTANVHRRHLRRVFHLLRERADGLDHVVADALRLPGGWRRLPRCGVLFSARVTAVAALQPPAG